MSHHIVILTGAGISADSGIETYRDAGGLWEGHRFEEVATPEGWAADPALVWRFYQQRRAQMASVEPNAAHHALVRLAKGVAELGGRLTLVTQNVDDLHQRAGSEVLAMHGQLSHLRCEGCSAVVYDSVHLTVDEFVTCEACGHAPLRPDVVWFSEVPYHLEEIEAAASQATIFASIGTSGAVYPAAAYLSYARANGAKTVVLGLAEPDNLEERDEFRGGRASESVPDWVEELLG